MATFDFDRKSFDRIAPTYEESRPGYGAAVYDCIDSIRPYSPGSRILEVGAGSGIATREIAERWHPRITALEPGRSLGALARANLAAYENVEIVESTFEDYEGAAQRFDGIFSATAFHWIDPDIKYRKAFDLLTDDGLLVLYWNNYGIQDAALGRAVEELYAAYGMKTDSRSVYERQLENMTRRRNEIGDSGLFRVIKHALFRTVIPYSKRKYLGLLATFSDHSKEKVPAIDSFYRDVGGLIDGCNGVIEVTVTVNLEIARKLAAASAATSGAAPRP